MDERGEPKAERRGLLHDPPALRGAEGAKREMRRGQLAGVGEPEHGQPLDRLLGARAVEVLDEGVDSEAGSLRDEVEHLGSKVVRTEDHERLNLSFQRAAFLPSARCGRRP
jgi:hypothetical protein